MTLKQKDNNSIPALKPIDILSVWAEGEMTDYSVVELLQGNATLPIKLFTSNSSSSYEINKLCKRTSTTKELSQKLIPFV